MTGIRHEWLGAKAELKPKRQRLEVECGALRDSLLRLLPTHVSVLTLDVEKIVDTSIALHSSRKELDGIEYQIRILSEKLGESE
jgi:hypothetical protein